MVALLDQNSASDGDIFPCDVSRSGPGPLIGKRSWGGVVGIQDRGPLIDGGSGLRARLRLGESRRASGSSKATASIRTSKWRTIRSRRLTARDPQLERGIAEVMAKLKTPVKLPARPAPPVKTIR